MLGRGGSVEVLYVWNQDPDLKIKENLGKLLFHEGFTGTENCTVKLLPRKEVSFKSTTECFCMDKNSCHVWLELAALLSYRLLCGEYPRNPAARQQNAES